MALQQKSSEEIITAHVLMKAPNGTLITYDTILTSQNIQRYTPRSVDLASATNEFETLGFKTGPVSGLSFAISGPSKVFEKVFHVRLQTDKTHGTTVIGQGESPQYELPLVNIPRSLARLLSAVTFMPPPEFGPTNYY